MLFNSFEFLFVFLPLTLAAFTLTARWFGGVYAIWVLVLASLFFYSWWNPVYLPLLLFSMVFNFYWGRYLGKRPDKLMLGIGVFVNLGLIGYFKYAGFIVLNLELATGQDFDFGDVILPLAISFFTFQQIAYLVDSYQGITHEYNFMKYALFVSFFPQLIAGPIVHHKEMLPQFEQDKVFRLRYDNLVIGLSIFAIGLFKKTVVADGMAVYATPVFAAADGGSSLDFFSAWGGALAYTFQLYYDFSGYSDMAIGVARMFGIVLPLNFYSPYKAANISEFWRRWHMTLSRFLRDYLYIALGGNRHGKLRRYANLFTTMLLGGLWHGAGWNFVIWGALHGAYLTLHQVWLTLLGWLGLSHLRRFRLYAAFAWVTTFVFVIFGWVFFRATTFDGATNMLGAMFGANGIALPSAIMARLGPLESVLTSLGVTVGQQGGSAFVMTWLWIVVLLPLTLILPNTQDMFKGAKCSLSDLSFERESAVWPFVRQALKLQWQATPRWAILCAVVLGCGTLTLMQVSEFLYFQF